ncbi:hypothetical protein F3I16_02610 [Pseudomonas sp. L-22-4S-12]|uniref:hypothetical protein n=1 Tax=Pseudomonas sp. L-22-4S-12 TaxID=2610893 RepID=UPI001326C09F|nr:hypothetical protein [Pseudomonas sp. L-22-4S-12]MWV14927.1 hypothetical protein [Pseudomonas sp. L-22-4S-12]
MKIVKWWFILTLISMSIYTPVYLVANDALDALDEATLVDLLPTVGIINRDYEREAASMARLGIDTGKQLGDALDDNPLIDDYEIDFVDSEEARQVLMLKGLKLVEIKAETENGNTLSLVFATLDKKFLKHYAAIGPMTHFSVSNGEDSYNVGPEEMTTYLSVLFADEDEHAAEAIAKLESFLPSKAQKAQQAFAQAMASTEASSPAIAGTAEQQASEPVQAEPVAALQAAIDAHIQQATARDGGAEYREARVVRNLDLNGDGEQDALVLYSIEGQGGGNGSFQTLAVLHAQDGGYALQASTVVNGSATDVKLLAAQTIGVSSLTLGPDDAMCCPTVESLQKFSWDGRQLVEVR